MPGLCPAFLAFDAQKEIDVTRSRKDYGSLILGTTYGAAKFDSDYKYLRPYNILSIYGGGGDFVFVTVDNGAMIDERDANHGTFQLDYNGQEHLHIYMPSDSANSETSITVTSASYRGEQGTSMQFFDPKRSQEDHVIWGYTYTTQAPADGKTPCSVYVSANTEDYPQLKTIRVTVDGTAIIDTFFQNQADVPLAADGSMTANIINLASGTVKVELSYPDISSGATETFHVVFVDPPTPG